MPKTAEKFYCKNCDFICSKQSNWDAHLLTRKHTKSTNSNIYQQKNADYFLLKFACECGKEYKDRSGLWRHKKNCQKLPEKLLPEVKQLLEQNTLLMMQNSEFKELLIEQQKHLLEITKAQSIVNNNYVQSNINNQFNLQLFLNDTCKDAMTIDDFINSLNPTIHDLEETGRLGYSAGITRIIVNGLKELDVSKRPIHCSDLKRETMFVKNTDKWERETDEKPILLKAVKEIGKKNIMNIKEWQKNNTHFNHYESKQNDAYLQIVTNSMSGGTEEEQLANYNKIIKNIAKETLIDKK
jgi:predicted small secreted protein